MANIIKKFNLLTKTPGNKTGYTLQEGDPIFGDKLYLLKPEYVHARSPQFTLVSKGKHISSLYPSGQPGWYTGDHNTCGLLIHLKENSFELFQSSVGHVELKARLFAGTINGELFEARRGAQQFVNTP